MPAGPSCPIPPGLAPLRDASPLQEAEPSHLLAYLATIPDPRGALGRRHPLVAILALAAAAVLAGARSFAAIAEWATDAPQPVRAALGARRDAPDHWAVPAEAPSAARSAGWTPTPWPPRSAPGSPTASAMTAATALAMPRGGGHGSGRWRSTARPCVAPATPPATAARCTCWRRWTTPAARCWPNSRSAARPKRSPAFGRIEVRTLKAVTVHHLGFPHAAQVIQVTRKRTVGVPHASGRRRRWQTVTVYAITSLPFEAASPARLADLLRGHWAIEAVHHIRDTTFAEDGSQVRTGAGPHVMATLRNLVIGMLSRAGPVNLAAALRHHARDPARPLATLGITPGSNHA